MANNILRNLQKRAKKIRHEQEKDYMDTLASTDEAAAGRYLGCGQGDDEMESFIDDAASVVTDVDVYVDAQSVVDSSPEDEGTTSNPLLFFYDCETTGLSIYNDHITEVAAKVVFQDNPPPISKPTYSSLVRTTRRIPAAGGQKSVRPSSRTCTYCMLLHFSVSDHRYYNSPSSE